MCRRRVSQTERRARFLFLAVVLIFSYIPLSERLFGCVASYPVGILGKGDLSLNLTDHVHVVPHFQVHAALSSRPVYVFMVWHLDKRRNNFTFTLHPDTEVFGMFQVHE